MTTLTASVTGVCSRCGRDRKLAQGGRCWGCHGRHKWRSATGLQVVLPTFLTAGDTVVIDGEALFLLAVNLVPCELSPAVQVFGFCEASGAFRTLVLDAEVYVATVPEVADA